MAQGFYENNLELPHPPISLSVFLVVEAALRATWDLMRTKPNPNLQLLSEDEDPVTCELSERMCNEVFNRGVVDGFDRSLFAKPTRESKLKNYNGKNQDKMPDLLIDLVDRPVVRIPAQDWLFVECKPVQSGRSAGAHYCDKGIIRFVRGDYAWAMPSALMVGYVTENYTLSKKLIVALKKRKSTLPTLDFPTPCAHSPVTRWSEPVHISKHGRTFRYDETNRPAPPIVIRHLWLRRD
ncbi:MAG: hypothetical protein ABI042_20240 [Verrucomicrobiota bacterium]